MITEKDIEIIESYLEDKLSEQEAKNVRVRLQKDKEFRKQLEIIRDLPSAVTSSSDAFKKDLRGIMAETEILSTKKRPFRLVSMITAIAASVALILAVTFLVRDTTTQDLYATYFDLPPDNISVRNNEEVSIHLTQALNEYANENHPAAIEQFEIFLDEASDHQGARFFYSLSLMANNNFKSAIRSLESLESEGGQYTNAAKWYLGLALVKLDSVSEARVRFEELSKSETTYKDKAQMILRGL